MISCVGKVCAFFFLFQLLKYDVFLFLFRKPFYAKNVTEVAFSVIPSMDLNIKGGLREMQFVYKLNYVNMFRFCFVNSVLDINEFFI